MKALTERQEEVIRAIAQFLREHQCYPTYRYLAKHLELSSTNAVTCHLRALEQKGWVEWQLPTTGAKNSRSKFCLTVAAQEKFFENTDAKKLAQIKQYVLTLNTKYQHLDNYERQLAVKEIRRRILQIIEGN